MTAQQLVTATIGVWAMLLTSCAVTRQQLQPLTIAAAVPGNEAYTVAICDSSYFSRAANCTVTGSGDTTLFKGIVISAGRILVGGEVFVGQSGKVEEVGCSVRRASVTVDCPGALISASFINLHEHIEYSYSRPAAPPTKRWNHRNEWRHESPQDRGFDYKAPQGAEAAEVSERAMLRHLMSGTTAVSGAKAFTGFVRNLDSPDADFGNPRQPPVRSDTFPLGDAALNTSLLAPCDAAKIKELADKLKVEQPLVAHVGEGVDAGARYEGDCMIGVTATKTTPNAFIHAVSMSAAQADALAQRNISVVLSPRSNFQLYGATAPIPMMMAARLNLAIGTDWAPSGSLTMLDEMRCLGTYNKQNLSGFIDGSAIHRMATENAAKAVGLDGQLGRLAVNEWADLVIIDSQGARDVWAMLEAAGNKHVIAVFVGGRAAMFPVGWQSSMTRAQPRCELDTRRLCSKDVMVCGANASRPLSALLQSKLYAIDDAALCAPQPTTDCRPLRAGLYDGVGKAGVFRVRRCADAMSLAAFASISAFKSDPETYLRE